MKRANDCPDGLEASSKNTATFKALVITLVEPSLKPRVCLSSIDRTD